MYSHSVDGWLESISIEQIQGVKELVEEENVPYVDYYSQFASDGVERFISEWEHWKGDQVSYPSELREWLDEAESALEEGEVPVAPGSRWADEDGHTYDACLACGAVYRDDEKKDCGCPVGVESTLPPEEGG
jgi:hypothetical protein